MLDSYPSGMICACTILMVRRGSIGAGFSAFFRSQPEK
jgi:hypothetical protein